MAFEEQGINTLYNNNKSDDVIKEMGKGLQYISMGFGITSTNIRGTSTRPPCKLWFKYILW